MTASASYRNGLRARSGELRMLRSIRIMVLAAGAGGCGGAGALDLVAPVQPVDPARVRIVVPEVYELANIIVAMTSYGEASASLVLKKGEYYQRVRAAFAPFRDDASMRSLQLGDADPVRRYYEIRDNSYAYVFDGALIKRNPAYTTLRNPNTFRDRMAEVQRFADVSGFRAFYAANADYYRELIERYRLMSDLESMVDWLEQEFAPRRYDHYTVVLSPLVYGSHSSGSLISSAGSEALMLVSGPDVTSAPGTSPGVQQAIVQRIVFTEVDHQFVNPVTDQSAAQVTRAFGTRSKWTTDGSSFYQSPVAVFNEYMTWAVFLLYLEGRLDAGDFAETVRLTTELMEGARRFHRFGLFAEELRRLYRTRPEGSRVPSLYHAMLEWAAAQ
jgi:hypothetical protein